MQKVSNYKTATAYAEAWLEASKNNKAEDDVLQEVKALREGISAISDLWSKFSAPIESEEQQYDIITTLADKISLSPISKSILQVIAENNRLNLIFLILDKYIHLYYKDKGIIEVSIDTAIALSSEQDKQLKQALETKLNSPVIIDYHIKPEILGGLAIRYNSFLIDDTLQSKIARIEHTITQTKV